MRQFIKTVGNVDFKKIQHRHGELFIQACLDSGNSPATVRKKIGTLKRVFQLTVERGQLDENPFRFVRKPKSFSKAIRIFSEQECRMLIKTALDTKIGDSFRWDIIFLLALTTAMRRGEILNITWKDIDFENNQINVAQKKDTEFTWQWEIKDKEHRRLPLTEEVSKLLTKHHNQQPESFPYVFVLPQRYERIQKLRKEGKWSQRKASCPANNFRRQFQLILSHAGIEDGEFHDLRRTCITNWFRNGLSEYDVMTMAGHSSFETTRKFYLAVRNDLLEKTKAASSKALSNMSVANLLQ
ncbi:MAG: site-specific integrase [Anaerohalosphaeraceae bacterium]|nr:site-specific integrase [Anaerohalosphaeraceae bacterium]